MNALKKLIITLLSAFGIASQAHSATPEKSPAEVMRDLRLQVLSTPAKDFGLSPTKSFPRLYAVLIDFPISQFTATIVSLSDGNASLYTTSTFGVIGGGSHEAVKSAATKLVTASDNYFEQAAPTKDFSYPKQGKVRFYLVSFNGVRLLEADLADIESNKSNYSKLFWLGQEVMTQLRLVTEKK